MHRVNAWTGKAVSSIPYQNRNLLIQSYFCNITIICEMKNKHVSAIIIGCGLLFASVNLVIADGGGNGGADGGRGGMTFGCQAEGGQLGHQRDEIGAVGDGAGHGGRGW